MLNRPTDAKEVQASSMQKKGSDRAGRIFLASWRSRNKSRPLSPFASPIQEHCPGPSASGEIAHVQDPRYALENGLSGFDEIENGRGSFAPSPGGVHFDGCQRFAKTQSDQSIGKRWVSGVLPYRQENAFAGRGHHRAGFVVASRFGENDSGAESGVAA
jgi:hypothetical protein